MRRAYKIFIRKNFKKLKEVDKYKKMFDENGKFVELKGSCFDEELKNEFMDFFYQNNLFEVRYIILDNQSIDEKFIDNKARTFNYLLKLFLINSIKCKYIEDKELYLNIDERNVKTDSKFSLEDYLNQELILSMSLVDKVKVHYYDSCQNIFIQIADVFSNILYSNILTKGKYDKKIENIVKEGYILPVFNFPQKKFTKKMNKK